MKFVSFLLWMALHFTYCAFGQDQNAVPPFISDSLDSYITKSMAEWQIPGLALGIVKNGKVITLKGYGYLHQNQKEPVNENSLFMIGSNTKAFTSTALAILEYEKKCSLNDKVIKWLPKFKMNDAWITNELSLTDLLCHRIGFDNNQGDFIYWASNLTATQVTEKMGKQSLTYGFRSKYGYSNTAFLLAGECIEKISGSSWSDFLKKRIYEPLRMITSQALTVDFIKQQNIAGAHTFRNDSLVEIPIENMDNLNAAASMSSSASDMCHWLICQLDSGRYEGKQVIPFQAIEKTRAPVNVVGRSNRPYNNSHFDLYGLGWRLTDYDGKEIIGHSGAVDGYHSSVTMIPEIQLGIVILTNSDVNNFYDALKWDIIDAFLHLPPRTYSKLYLTKWNIERTKEQLILKGWKDTINQNLVPTFKIEKYAGNYFNEDYGNIRIFVENGKLVIHFEHHPDLTGKLESLGGNRFLCTYSNPEFGIRPINFTILKKKPSVLYLSVSENLDSSVLKFRRK